MNNLHLNSSEFHQTPIVLENQLIQVSKAHNVSPFKKLGTAIQKNKLIFQCNSMLTRPLSHAIEDGNLIKVKTLIKLGASLNSFDPKSTSTSTSTSTPVMLALLSKRKEILEYFIRQGANLPMTTESFRLVLSQLINEQWISEKEILSLQLSSNTVNPQNNQNSLHRSVAYNLDIHIIKKLIALNDINEQDSEGNTALHCAILQERQDIVHELLSQPDIDYLIYNNAHINPLEQIINIKSIPLIETYIDLNPKQVIQNCRTFIRYSPLFEGRVILDKILNLLEKNKIDSHDSLRFHSENGTTPLHIAAQAGNLEVTKYLLEKNVDVYAQNHQGEMPAHLAIENNHFQVFSLLKDRIQSKETALFTQYLDTGKMASDFNNANAFTENPNFDNIAVRHEFEQFFNIDIKSLAMNYQNSTSSLGFVLSVRQTAHMTESALLCTHGRGLNEFFSLEGETRLSFIGPANHVLYSDTFKLNKLIKNETGLKHQCDMRAGTNAQALPGERLRNVNLTPSKAGEISIKIICQTLAYLQLSQTKHYDILILNPYNRDQHAITLKNLLPFIAATRHDKKPYNDLVVECCRGLSHETTATENKYLFTDSFGESHPGDKFKTPDLE